MHASTHVRMAAGSALHSRCFLHVCALVRFPSAPSKAVTQAATEIGSLLGVLAIELRKQVANNLQALFLSLGTSPTTPVQLPAGRLSLLCRYPSCWTYQRGSTKHYCCADSAPPGPIAITPTDGVQKLDAERQGAALGTGRGERKKTPPLQSTDKEKLPRNPVSLPPSLTVKYTPTLRNPIS